MHLKCDKNLMNVNLGELIDESIWADLCRTQPIFGFDLFCTRL